MVDKLTESVYTAVELNKLIEKHKNYLIEQQRQLMKPMLEIFFDRYQSLLSFSWTQYTPYFCDGGACTFFRNIDQGIDYKTIDGEYFSFRGNTDEELDSLGFFEIDEDCLTILYVFSDQDFLDMFGNDVKVTITRDGQIKTERYNDHE